MSWKASWAPPSLRRVREELTRLAWRGAEEGFRLTIVGAKLAIERAEKAGVDVSLVRGLLSGKPPPPAPDPIDAPPVDGLYEGLVHVDVGPFERFSQLVELEDAANEIGAAGEIEVERFSSGRATLTMDLATPTDLVAELESHTPFPLTIRRTTGTRVVLDVPAGTETHE